MTDSLHANCQFYCVFEPIFYCPDTDRGERPFSFTPSCILSAQRAMLRLRSWLLLLVDVDILGVDDIAFLFGFAGGCCLLRSASGLLCRLG